MRTPLRHYVRRLAALALGLTFAGGMFPTIAAAASPFKIDLYFTAGYEPQVDERTCTAGSTAMMLNFIARRDLDLDQMTILRYEQSHDSLSNSRGSDALGWSRALKHFSTKAGEGRFIYRWKAYTSEYKALKQAARRIAVTGKPIGLVIWNGRHAVVMTGFKATSDPREGGFKLKYVWISDPYGSSHRRYTAARSPLDRYYERDAPGKYTKAWYGKYVIVVPKTPTPTPAPTPKPSPTPTPSPEPTPPPAATPAPPPTPEPSRTPPPPPEPRESPDVN